MPILATATSRMSVQNTSRMSSKIGGGNKMSANKNMPASKPSHH